MTVKAWRLNYGILNPDPDGAWFVHQLEKGFKAISRNGLEAKPCWSVGDDRFSLTSTKPKRFYQWLVDRYIYDEKGTVTISGNFPFYVASDGHPCFIDHDGSFIRAPVDFLGRVQQRHKDLTINRTLKKRSIKKDRMKFTIDETETNYSWIVTRNGQTEGTGTAANRVKAERDARRFIDLRTKGG